MAIASMVLGILGLVVGWFCCGIVMPLLAVIFGHISFSKISRNPHLLEGKGFAIAGFTMGYVGLAIGVIYALVVGTFAAMISAIGEGVHQAMGQMPH